MASCTGFVESGSGDVPIYSVEQSEVGPWYCDVLFRKVELGVAMAELCWVKWCSGVVQLSLGRVLFSPEQQSKAVVTYCSDE